MPVDGGEERGGEGTKEDTEEDGEVPADQGDRSNPTDGQTHLCWNKEVDHLSSSQLKLRETKIVFYLD